MSKAKETHGLQDFGCEGKEFGIPLVLQGFMIQTHIPDSHLSINGELYKGFLSIPGIGFGHQPSNLHQTKPTKPPNSTFINETNVPWFPEFALQRPNFIGGCLERPVEIILEGPLPATELELHEASWISLGVLASIPLLDHRCREKSSFNSVYSFQVVYVVHQHYDFSKESKSNPTLNQILLYQPPFCNWVSQFHPSKNAPPQDPMVPSAPIADPRCQAMELELWRRD